MLSGKNIFKCEPPREECLLYSVFEFCCGIRYNEFKKTPIEGCFGEKHRKFNFLPKANCPERSRMQLKNIDGASEAVSAENRKERANEMG